MSDLAPAGSRVEGNTNSSTHKDSRSFAAKRWCFTVFPAIGEDTPEVDPVAPGFDGCQWLAGLETCPDTQRLHYQGYVEFPIKVRPIGYKGFPKTWHWTKCRGTREENITYCSKEDDNPLGNLRPKEKLFCPEMYGWQEEVVKEVTTWPCADRRRILWRWSEAGGLGKSDLCRFLCIKHGALICAGKACDMKYMVQKYVEQWGNGPRIVIFDVPRSSSQFLSYTGMEEIKNGIFASTKYESGMCTINSPHMLVLANIPPEFGKMSVNRYDVVQIDETKQDEGTWQAFPGVLGQFG